MWRLSGVIDGRLWDFCPEEVTSCIPEISVWREIYKPVRLALQTGILRDIWNVFGNGAVHHRFITCVKICRTVHMKKLSHVCTLGNQSSQWGTQGPVKQGMLDVRRMHFGTCVWKTGRVLLIRACVWKKGTVRFGTCVWQKRKVWLWNLCFETVGRVHF